MPIELSRVEEIPSDDEENCQPCRTQKATKEEEVASNKVDPVASTENAAAEAAKEEKEAAQAQEAVQAEEEARRQEAEDELGEGIEMAAVERLKLRGNTLFGRGMFEEALRLYDLAAARAVHKHHFEQKQLDAKEERRKAKVAAGSAAHNKPITANKPADSAHCGLSSNRNKQSASSAQTADGSESDDGRFGDDFASDDDDDDEHLTKMPKNDMLQTAAQRAETIAQKRLDERRKQEEAELYGAPTDGKEADNKADEEAAKEEEEPEEADTTDYTLTAQVYCNAAACCMKLSRYNDAVDRLTAAVHHKADYDKAFYRRADCYWELQQFSSCHADLSRYVELGGVLDAEHKRRLAAAKEKMDEEMQKMLGQLKDLGNMFLGKFGLSTENFKFDKDPNTGGYSMRFEK